MLTMSHLSFIINLLLPLRLVDVQRCKKKINAFLQSDGAIKAREEGIALVPTGSLSEGLNMPPVFNRKSNDNVYFEENTDVDQMEVEIGYPVTFSQEKRESGEYFALLDTHNMHPSYVKLIFSTDKNLPEYKQRVLYHRLLSASKEDPPPDTISVNGPAVTTVTTLQEEEVHISKYVYKRTNRHLQDSVVALPCSEWPPLAANWIQRQRKSKWIGDELIDSLIMDGCHIVPAAHRLSSAPYEEWRISFAATEGRIAREIISNHQRQVYVFLKILYNHTLKQSQIITSYHLKTIFLYACELQPASRWEDNKGACFFYMLDMLIECVQKKRLPNFFIPENNLIDYLKDEELDSVLLLLESLRADPITPILDFTDDRVVGFSTLFHSTFRELLEPVLLDIQEYPKHKNVERSVLEAFSLTLFTNMTNLMFERQYREAAYFAKDLHSLLVKHKLTEDTFGEFCMWNVASKVADPSHGAKFLESVIEMYREEPDIECCISNLACMYHAASYRYPKGSVENIELIEKTDHAFKAKLEKQNEPEGDCDYALFLLKQSRFDEAINTLETVIKANNMNACNSYDANEIMTLDEVLQNEVVEHFSFSSPSVSLAYYLLISCLERNKKDVCRASEWLKKFKVHADDTTLPRTYALYGYCCILLGEWTSGSEAFNTAYNLNVGADYTRALRMKKYCDAQLDEELGIDLKSLKLSDTKM